MPDREVGHLSVEEVHRPSPAGTHLPPVPPGPKVPHGLGPTLLDAVQVEPHHPAGARGQGDVIPGRPLEHVGPGHGLGGAIVKVVLELPGRGQPKLMGVCRGRTGGIGPDDEPAGADALHPDPGREGVARGAHGVGDLDVLARAGEVCGVGGHRARGNVRRETGSEGNPVEPVAAGIQEVAVQGIVSLRREGGPRGGLGLIPRGGEAGDPGGIIEGRVNPAKAVRIGRDRHRVA